MSKPKDYAGGDALDFSFVLQIVFPTLCLVFCNFLDLKILRPFSPLFEHFVVLAGRIQGLLERRGQNKIASLGLRFLCFFTFQRI